MNLVTPRQRPRKVFLFPSTVSSYIAPKRYIHPMHELERITINPNQCGGRPCVRGMRIRVKDVLDMLAGGATQAQILVDFPDLEAADIRACIAYAARYLDHAVLVAA